MSVRRRLPDRRPYRRPRAADQVQGCLMVAGAMALLFVVIAAAVGFAMAAR